jgi:hypothetical protein
MPEEMMRDLSSIPKCSRCQVQCEKGKYTLDYMEDVRGKDGDYSAGKYNLIAICLSCLNQMKGEIECIG